MFGESCLRQLWTYLLVALVAAGFLFPFVRTFSEAPDYGVFLNGADLLNHGAVPSRDFVEPQGPGSFVWLALCFRVFGTSFETARGVLLATGVGLSLLAFYLSRRFGATGFMAAVFVTAISIPLLPINSPHYDSNLLALAALALFVIFWDRPMQMWALVTSAILCGLTTCTIQQKGCYLAAALVVSLAARHFWRAAMVFGCVFTICALLPFGFFAYMHALPEVWFANFMWPMRSYTDLNAAPYGFPAWQNFLVLFRSNWAADLLFSFPFMVIAVLPFVLPLAGVWAKWSLALPCWLAAYALWLSELHRLDIGHLRNGVVLVAILFFSLCERSGRRVFRTVGLICTLCTGVAAAGTFVTAWQSTQRVETRRGAIYVEHEQPLFSFLETHTNPGDELFVYPYQPIYYFAEQLTNPTRYSYLQYHFHTDAQFREAVSDLERKKVRYVIFDTALAGPEMTRMFPAYRHPSKDKLILEPYLDKHYSLVEQLGRFQVKERLR